MHVHLIGVAGTGMGALAGLLREAGHRVTGSDTAFYPPMGDALVRWGVTTHTGFSPTNLEPTPDLVVVGNVCRPTNPEARAALDRGLKVLSLPGALEELCFRDRPVYVVAGTHGKTTTTALLAWLLSRATTQNPGFLIGGVPLDFDVSARLGAPGSPFVIEGDEYDSAFFEKTPKFWRYRPRAALLTSVEHDHIDIYPDPASYEAAFRGFIERIPVDGVLVAYAGDPIVRRLAGEARCKVRFYALAGDETGGVDPVWTAATAGVENGAQGFDLFVGGSSCGRWASPLMGAHNLRNALGALALAAEAAELPVAEVARALARFGGVRRRQELRGVADGVSVYDDFAHHPTAVRETVSAVRSRHSAGRLFAIFEPRSATASRRLHQEGYAQAFGGSDVAVLAEVGRPEIADGERLDVARLVSELGTSGLEAHGPLTVDAIVALAVRETKAGDVLLVMSNGAFGGIHEKLLLALTARRLAAKAKAKG